MQKFVKNLFNCTIQGVSKALNHTCPIISLLFNLIKFRWLRKLMHTLVPVEAVIFCFNLKIIYLKLMYLHIFKA